MAGRTGSASQLRSPAWWEGFPCRLLVVLLSVALIGCGRGGDDAPRTTAFQEASVTVGGEWELPGTLALPEGKGPFPAVVLVHGSGPNDRDETVGPSRPFRDLAHGLAGRGIAVLRYDKRALVHRRAMAAIPGGPTLDEDTTDDALAAVDLLRGQPGIDRRRIYVLGHSQGGFAAPRIGERDRAIAGLIVLAGPARPLDVVVREQIEYVGGLPDEAVGGAQAARAARAERDRLLSLLANVRAPDLSASTPPAQLPFGAPRFWLDVRDERPAERAARLEQPMLILQGERDYQVTTADLDVWRQALAGRKNVRLRSYPSLNHLFIAGEGKATPAEYARAGHVADEVIEEIAAWIRGRR